MGRSLGDRLIGFFLLALLLGFVFLGFQQMIAGTP